VKIVLEGELKERYLNLNIENAPLACCCNILYSLYGGAIKVSRKLGMLDESALRDEVLKGIGCCKVICFAVYLTRTWGAGSIFGMGTN
jgi:hypothetical protein